MQIIGNRRQLTAVGIVGLALFASACSGGSEGPEGPAANENEVDSTTSQIQGWTDVCEVFNPDALSEQLDIAEYSEGPNHIGMNEGNFPGALKCNFSFDFPEYPGAEHYGSDRGGWVYMVLAPYASAEEAADAYQTTYDDVAQQLHQRPEMEQVVDREISGEWDEGAVLASVGTGNTTRAMYLKDSYFVYIDIGYNPDPGVEEALSLKSMETFESPVYEFTPPELADWFESDYLPNLNETISSKLEE
ncbi:hypothetical protein GCM10027447_03710 [Glycomyces halotolerans]